MDENGFIDADMKRAIAGAISCAIQRYNNEYQERYDTLREARAMLREIALERARPTGRRGAQRSKRTEDDEGEAAEAKAAKEQYEAQSKHIEALAKTLKENQEAQTARMDAMQEAHASRMDALQEALSRLGERPADAETTETQRAHEGLAKDVAGLTEAVKLLVTKVNALSSAAPTRRPPASLRRRVAPRRDARSFAPEAPTTEAKSSPAPASQPVVDEAVVDDPPAEELPTEALTASPSANQVERVAPALDLAAPDRATPDADEGIDTSPEGAGTPSDDPTGVSAPTSPITPQDRPAEVAEAAPVADESPSANPTTKPVEAVLETASSARPTTAPVATAAHASVLETDASASFDDPDDVSWGSSVALCVVDKPDDEASRLVAEASRAVDTALAASARGDHRTATKHWHRADELTARTCQQRPDPEGKRSLGDIRLRRALSMARVGDPRAINISSSAANLALEVARMNATPEHLTELDATATEYQEIAKRFGRDVSGDDLLEAIRTFVEVERPVISGADDLLALMEATS